MASKFGYGIEIILRRYDRGDSKESIQLRNYYHGDAAPTQPDAEIIFTKIKQLLIAAAEGR